MSLWPLGVALGIAGSVGNNLGNNLVSLGESIALEAEKQEKMTQISGSTSPNINNSGNDLGSHPDDSSNLESGCDGDRKPKPAPCCTYACCTDLRTIGVVVIIVFNLLNFVSYGFAAQALLAALESTQFVSNVIFVRFVHKEKISLRVAVGTILIVIGNIVVVYFGPKSFRNFTSDDMIDLYLTNHLYWGYLAVTGVMWFITTGIYITYYNARMNHRKLLRWHTFLEPFCYSFSAGLVGAQAVLKSRCMALLLQSAAIGLKNEFAFWYLWFLLALWLGLILYWLSRLFYGLKLYPPVFIIPVIQVFFLLFAIICGGMYFKEFNKFTAIQFAGFSIGVLMIIMGVYGLAPPDMKLRVPGDDEVEGKSPFDELEAGALGDADRVKVDDEKLENSMNLEKKMSKQAVKYAVSPELDQPALTKSMKKPEMSPRNAASSSSFAIAPIVEQQSPAAAAVAPTSGDQSPLKIEALMSQPPPQEVGTPATHINRNDQQLGEQTPAKTKSQKKRKVLKRPPSAALVPVELPPVKLPATKSATTAATVAVTNSDPSNQQQQDQHS